MAGPSPSSTTPPPPPPVASVTTTMAPTRVDGVTTSADDDHVAAAVAVSSAGGGASGNDDFDGDRFAREDIYRTNDSILADYVSLISRRTDGAQYWNSRSSRLLIRSSGSGDLPTNQIEVLLRRKAIIKTEDVDENGESFIRQQRQQQQQQQQRRRQQRMNIGVPDMSSLDVDESSTVCSDHSSTKVTPLSSVRNIDTTGHGNDDAIPNKTTATFGTTTTTTTATTTTTTTTTPIIINEEDIIGDTSLGLKLTIIRGKVIIQHIVPLADGTTSPAQLVCNGGGSGNGGLLLPGDVIIGVNGKTLLSNPNGGGGVGGGTNSMDKILSVLRPLSSPTNTVTKVYCRVVKLRIALGDGKALLAEQEERECKLAKEKERRQKLLGWDGSGSGGNNNNNHDPVADLFGIGSFMAVDQHGGLSMFGNNTNNNDDNFNIDKSSGSNVIGNNGIRVEPTANMDDSMIDQAGTTSTINNLVVTSGGRVEPTAVMYSPTLQSQIAYQTLLDLQYIRQRNTSEYYTLNNTISNTLLRPPLPPESSSSRVFVNVVNDQYGNNINKSNINILDVNKRRIENGAQMITNAISYLTLVESQDLVDEEKGIDNAMVVVDEDGQKSSSSSSNNKDSRCSINDQQQQQQQSLIELAATNEYWQSNIVQQLAASVLEDMNNEMKVSPGGGTTTTTTTTTSNTTNNNNTRRLGRIDSCTTTSTSSVVEEESALTIGFDTFLFGKAAVAGITPRTQSLAMPPVDVTSTLYDLINEIECDLPYQIYTMNDTSSSPANEGDDKVVSFAAAASEDDNFVNGGGSNYDFNSNTNNIVIQATAFLLTTALGIWLRTFRPLQWKYRRVLWSTTNQFNTQGLLDGDHTTMISSRMSDDDDTVMSLMSTSLMSGFTSKKTTTTKKKKKKKKTRDLRELIEDVALNQEIGGKMCRLVTFFFTRRLLLNNNTSRHSPEVKKEKEKEAISLIDTYGSYLDIYKCLVFAGKAQSKVILDKLMELANYDPQHKIAMKALQNESTTLLLYEPSMFSALLEVLPSMPVKQSSGVVDYVPLLVSAYPDLQPWFIRETLQFTACDFYQQYLTSLLHYEDGNDVAKQDVELVKEWCTMLCSLDVENGSTINEDHCQSFLHIATPNNQNGYRRDLLFLMDCSMKISEYELTFAIANEIISHPKHCHDKQVLINVLQFLRIISDVAIEGKTSMLNKTLLGQLIEVYNAILPCMETNDCDFNLVSELSRLLDECSIKKRTMLQHDSSNRFRTCITTISETAPPTCTLRVLSNREYLSVEYFTLVTAIRTSLIRGARNGLRSAGLSGSLIQIQQAREEERRRRRRPTVECDIMTWKAETENSVEDKQESGGFIWASIFSGNAIIAK